MGIETTYNQLSSQIRRDNRKRNRTENLMGIASVATAAYQKNLKKEREELLEASELNNKKIRRQAGLDLFTNKYKTLYEQGTQSLGGLRTFLIDGKATEIAKQKLDAEVSEGRIANPDKYNKIIRNYATEMVDGSKKEGEDPQTGMLESLTNAYNKGKTLKSTEEYERFLINKADLPENAGVSIINRIFSNKNTTQINEDALKRIAEENDFDKNLAAFEVLDNAFNAGAGFAGAESLTKQYVAEIEKEKLVAEYIDKKRVEKKGQYLAPDGSMKSVAYSVIVGTDAAGVETTLPNSVEAVAGNPLSRQYIDAIKDGGKQIVMHRAVTITQTDITTGQKRELPGMEAYYATGESIGKVVTDKKPVTQEEIDTAVIESAAIEDSVLEKSNRFFLSWVGKTKEGNNEQRRTAIEDLKNRETNVESVNNEDYRKAVNQLFLQRANSMASVIRDQYKTGYETSFHIAYQLMYENSKTDEKSFYTGINTTDKDNLNINSYRVFEAISELDQNSDFVLNLGVSSKDKFVEEFVLLHLNKENSELKIKEDWDAVSKTQLRETNAPVGDTKITSDIWKARVPHPLYENINATSEEKKIRISLYERYLYHAYGIDPLQVKKQQAIEALKLENKNKTLYEKPNTPNIELQNTLSSTEKVKSIGESLETLKESEGTFFDLLDAEEGFGTKLSDGKIRRSIKLLSSNLIKLNSNPKINRETVQLYINDTVEEMEKYRKTTDTTPGQKERRKAIEKLYNVIFSKIPSEPSVPVNSILSPTTSDKTSTDITVSLYDAVEQIESGGDHSAVSPAGAKGVMQLMPETAKNPGFGIKPVKDDSEEENRRVGREYIDALLKKYDGNLDNALYAYNYGPGNIDKWITNGADPSQLPQETQDYIVKVKGAMSPPQPS